MVARRFLRHFFASIAVAMALVGAFNYAIDPFDLWHAPRLERLNTVKSIGNVRFVKPLQVEVRQPETVILGSSRALYGLDPKNFPHPNRTYNFGIHALTATEMRGYGEHILSDTEARHMVIELGFYGFNGRQSATPDYDNAVLGRAAVLRALPIVLFSQEAIGRSGRTITDSRRGARLITRSDGFAQFAFDPAKDPVDKFLEVIDQFSHSNGLYASNPGIDRPMAQYRSLLAAAKAKGVDVVSFIGPEHASLLVVIDRNGLWPLYKAWIRGLAEISSDLGVPLWDFSGFNAYTTTPMKDGYRAYFDASHFRPEIGRLMLARMQGAPEPRDFGVLLTRDTIEHRLADLDAGQARYRESHADDVARVEAAIDHPPRPRP